MKKLLLILALTFSSSAMAEYYEGTEYSPWSLGLGLLFLFVLSWGCVHTIKIMMNKGFDWNLCMLCLFCGVGIVWFLNG